MADWKRLYFERSLKTKYPKRAPRRLPRALPPSRLEAQYQRELIEILNFLKAKVDSKIKPMIPSLIEHYGRVRADADNLQDLADELEQVRLQFTQEYTPEEIRNLARITGRSVAEWNEKQMNGQLKGIVEIDLFGHESWLSRELGGFVVQNTDLIESIADEYLGQVGRMVATSVRSGIRYEELAGEIDERYDVGVSRAKLIARDQIGKLNGQITELRQKDLGIEKYIWRGVGDARERDSHLELNNTVQEWSDPPEVGHPSEDYQCRCWAEPDLSDLYDDEN